MPRKIGHSLEQYLANLDEEDIRKALELLRKKPIQRKSLCKYTYTICCPHCDRFFEFNLEVEK